MPNDDTAPDRVLTLSDGTELEVAHGTECVMLAARLDDGTRRGRLVGIVLTVDQAHTLGHALCAQANLARTTPEHE